MAAEAAEAAEERMGEAAYKEFEQEQLMRHARKLARRAGRRGKKKRQTTPPPSSPASGTAADTEEEEAVVDSAPTTEAPSNWLSAFNDDVEQFIRRSQAKTDGMDLKEDSTQARLIRSVKEKIKDAGVLQKVPLNELALFQTRPISKQSLHKFGQDLHRTGGFDGVHLLVVIAKQTAVEKEGSTLRYDVLEGNHRVAAYRLFSPERQGDEVLARVLPHGELTPEEIHAYVNCKYTNLRAATAHVMLTCMPQTVRSSTSTRQSCAPLACSA